MTVEPGALLLVRAGASTCGLPLESVSETMRPLPISVLGGAPPYVLGASMVRGAPTPVVDLGVLLGAPPLAAPRRYVVLRSTSPVALAVDEVLGVRRLGLDELGRMPRLLRDVGGGHLTSLAALDGELVPVLSGSIVVESGGAA